MQSVILYQSEPIPKFEPNPYRAAVIVPMFVALRTLARLLRVARHDLDLVSLDGLASVIHLKGHVLDEECPDFVAESIRI